MQDIKSFSNPLQKCSNLRILNIIDYLNVIPVDFEPLVLPSLRYFSFKTESFPSFRRNMPDGIKFPNLYETELTYSGSAGRRGSSVVEEWPCPGFKSILHSCSSTLRRLSIAWPRHALRGSVARQLLELSPSVTHLEIRLGQDDVAGFTETLLSVLTIPDGKTFSIAMPQLTSLTITINHGDVLLTEKIGRLIVDMMSSRSRKTLSEQERFMDASPLTKTYFDFRNPPTPSVVERTRILQASHRFLEITNKAQLDPDTDFRTFVGSRPQ